MKNWIQQKAIYIGLFVSALIYFGLELKMDDTILSPPHGIHQWRQSDGAAMARVFANDGNSILEPRILNQFGGNGNAGGEFPLTYYLSGKLYNVLGYQPAILRLIHLSFFVFGLLILLQYLFEAFKYKSTAIIALFISICSPTLMCYAISTLPDGAAFGLALGASGFLLMGLKNNSRSKQLIGIGLYALAALLKISTLLPFFAIAGSSLFSDSFKNVYANIRKWLAYAIVACGPVLLWFIYIAQYNKENNSAYFTTTIRPIWQYNLTEVFSGIESILDRWVLLIFPLYTIIFIVIGLIVVSFHKKLWQKRELYLIFLLLLGSLAYGLLFFESLIEHDYYYVAFFFLIIGLVSVAAKGIEYYLPKHKWLQIGAVALAFFLSWQIAAESVRANKKSYHGWFRDFSMSKSLFSIESFIDNKQIPREAKFVVPQDETSNVSLLFLNRKGYTKLSGIYDNDTTDAIIDKGVGYALVLDTSFWSINFLKHHIIDTVGFHHELGIYRIEHSPWYSASLPK